MASRKVLTEEQKDLVGRKCVNCGTDENIEYHHIVPLCNGGNDVISNIVPLCHACHRLAHGGRDLNEVKRKNGPLRGGRPAKCSDEEAFAALDLLIAGRIGNSECKRRMNVSERTEPRVTPQFRKYCDLRGIENIRTTYDVAATNSPENMFPGYNVGWVSYKDGRKEPIRYSGCSLNRTKYKYRTAKHFPDFPCELQIALGVYVLSETALQHGVYDELIRDVNISCPYTEDIRRRLGALHGDWDYDYVRLQA